MSEQLIATGKKIYINFDNTDLDGFNHVSQIVDIIDQSNVIISSPFFMGNPHRIRFGEIINILMLSQDGLYIFEARCAEEIIDNNITMYKVNINNNSKRLQRRNYFRLLANMPIVYEFSLDNEIFYGQATTKNISGGGIGFICSDDLKNNQIINITMRINEENEFISTARVIRCVNIGIKKFEVSAEYIDINTSKRDDLIKYLFSVQQEKLREKNNI